MPGGWSAQLDRARRWHARLQLAASPTDRYDFLFAFFENAFHLRDWLADSGAVKQSDLDAFIESSAEMRLCRDLANSHKHHTIRSPSQPAPPSEALEYDPSGGNLGNGTSVVILSDGTKWDALELASAVMRKWDGFVEGERPGAA
ncbi:MAG: hypothetical protein IT361_06080 [Gemmatimonadaceae bacterium]|nr:hypothetical protein [Gemmatimonadaceae bacterium]